MQRIKEVKNKEKKEKVGAALLVIATWVAAAFSMGFGVAFGFSLFFT